ncbi:hypothetical protein [Microbulbifer halophilus]|uniref:Glycoside-hydrolase family GH114 TIM-barrel domain-containing protein n=1 Tax=Microbulbifer halophilus TaxID=453963 RepID=A0ABW5EG35_9GAMM|nr:hypothetical protein [Microbulbifer halophilus]MCW8128255.1 hypothetical protein [Microbulbifer halophilus]
MKRFYTFLVLPLLLQGCDFDDVPNFLPEEGTTNYRQEMRDFVADIGGYGRGLDSNFIVVAHGGVELLSSSGTTNGSPDTSYINSLNGVGQDALFYGFDGIDQPTSTSRRERLGSFLDMALEKNATVMVTDFVFSEHKVDDSYALNQDAGYISFAADQTLLDNIPEYPENPFNWNRRDIEGLFEADNFLRLTNTGSYSTRQDLVDAVSDTDYDLVVLDPFFDGEAYTGEQIRQMRFKASGGERLLVAAVNIGEAESDRFYWQSHWVSNPPEWLGDEIPDSGGHYEVNYWRQGWQEIIYGDEDSYVFRVVDGGFDGVYLMGVDAYDSF